MGTNLEKAATTLNNHKNPFYRKHNVRCRVGNATDNG